jgi:hypothetical protein
MVLPGDPDKGQQRVCDRCNFKIMDIPAQKKRDREEKEQAERELADEEVGVCKTKSSPYTLPHSPVPSYSLFTDFIYQQRKKEGEAAEKAMAQVTVTFILLSQ